MNKDELKDKKVNVEGNECDCKDCEGCGNCENGECKCECKADSNVQEEAFDNQAVSELEAKNIDLDSKLRRVLADYANMQRDNEKRLEITLNQLKAKTGREIISVLDDVNFALQAKEKMVLDDKTNAWVDGLLSTLGKLNKSLEVLGIVPMDLKNGDTFDSEMHEALGVVYEGEPETIQTVVQTGYVMATNGMVVRPARVIVNKAQG